MAVSIQWLHSGSVLYSRYVGEVSLQDIIEAGEKQSLLIAQYNDTPRFQLIIDASQARQYPRSFKALRQVVDIALFKRIDWIVLVSNDYFQTHLVEVFAQLFGFRVHTSPTVLEAYRFLQSREDVLPPQIWPDNINDTMPQR